VQPSRRRFPDESALATKLATPEVCAPQPAVPDRKEAVSRLDRPRTHRDHHRIALDQLAVDLNPCDPTGLMPVAGNSAEPKLRALQLRSAHHRRGEASGMYLRCVLGRTKLLADHHRGRKPTEFVSTARTAESAEATVGVEPAISPILGGALRQLSMEYKAAARQWCERRAVAPVARQEPARFPRRGAGKAGTFDHRGLHAAAGKEIGERGADNAAAANQALYLSPRALADDIRRVLVIAIDAIMRFTAIVSLFFGAALVLAGNAAAASLTLKQVSETLVRAAAGGVPDFSGQDLSYLDLSELDFERARLVDANLYGADLSRANLSGADLSGANLDHAVIIRTNFSNANLSNARLFDTVAYSTLEASPLEAPNFAGAKLTGAQVLARLSGVDMHGADLTRIRMGMARDQLKTPLRDDLSGCNLSAAKLTDADLHEVRMAFVKLADADLSGANLVGADLTHADLTGANLSGADLDGADLDGAMMRHVKGLGEVKGLDHAQNRDKAIY
jgi:uncharacterized protein YjbI with pentapeptide repeats